MSIANRKQVSNNRVACIGLQVSLKNISLDNRVLRQVLQILRDISFGVLLNLLYRAWRHKLHDSVVFRAGKQWVRRELKVKLDIFEQTVH